MPGTLAVRLTVALAAVLLVLAILMGLAMEALRTGGERDLREGRFAYSLAQLKQRVESPLSLGLNIESLPQLQRLLEEEAAADQEILSLDLFDAEGRLLFTTDATGIRDAVPQGWLEAMRALPSPGEDADLNGVEVWQVEERGGQALGVALFNDFGLQVGGLALRHAVSDVGEEVLRSENRRLLLLLLLITAGGILAGGVGFWLLCRPLEREAAAHARALTGGAEAAPLASQSGLGHSAGALLQGLRKAETRCQEAAAEVERIDARN